MLSIMPVTAVVRKRHCRNVTESWDLLPLWQGHGGSMPSRVKVLQGGGNVFGFKVKGQVCG